MTLPEMAELLPSINTVAELDELVGNRGSVMTLAVLNSDVTSARGLQLLDKLYDAFFKSEVGRSFLRDREYSKGIHFLLETLGLAYERSEHGKMKRIAALVQSHSLGRRLRALSIIQKDCGFGYESYIENFPRVLNLLTEAQYDPADSSSDYTGYVLRILSYFKKHIENKITNKTSLNKVLQLFTTPENVLKWPILSQNLDPIQVLPIESQKFDFSKAASFPIKPSVVFNEIFNKIVDTPLREDPRTPYRNLQYPLGYESFSARRDIIGFGRADFRQPYANLSPSDRVLVYCLYNLRKHYFTSYYIYSAFIDNLYPLFANEQSKVSFVDLGCGPLTSGLALADLFLTRFKRPILMNYIGVDIAQAMLAKAEEFSNENELFSKSSFYFKTSLDDALDLLTQKLVTANNTIIVNASYLFASESLEVAYFAAFIVKLHVMCPNSPIFFIYQNPVAGERHGKYNQWKSELTDFEVVYQKVIPVEYQNKIDGEPSKPELVLYELLSYKL